MFDMIKLGKNISSRRKAQGMTQMGLADRLGVTYQAVSNWERGQTAPDISKLGELAEALNCTVDELLDSKRTAEVIRQVEQEVESPDITPEELADVAPILKPDQVDRTFGSIFSGLGDLIKDKVNGALKGADLQRLGDEINARVSEALEKASAKIDGFDPSRVKIVRHDTKDGGLHATITIDDEDEDCSEQDGEPEQDDRSKANSQSAMSFETLTRLAPFLSEDAVDDIIVELAENESTDADMLAAVAPFASGEVLGQAAKQIFRRDGSLEEVVALAPFLDEDVLGDIAVIAVERGGSLEEISALAPFLDEDVLGRVACLAVERGDDVSGLSSTACHMDEDAVAQLCRAHLKRGGSLDEIVGIAKLMNDSDLVDIAMLALEGGASLDELMPIIPLMDEEDVAHIYHYATDGRTSEQRRKPNHPERSHGSGFPFGKPWSRKGDDQ